MIDLTCRGLVATSPLKVPGHTAWYCYCSGCTRVYTLFTSRSASSSRCPKCSVAYRRHVRLEAVVQIRKELREPMRASSVTKWLAKIFNRAKLSSVTRWWKSNREEMNKRPASEVLTACFRSLSAGKLRSAVAPRPSTYLEAMTREITLALVIPETSRVKWTTDNSEHTDVRILLDQPTPKADQ